MTIRKSDLLIVIVALAIPTITTAQAADTKSMICERQRTDESRYGKKIIFDITTQILSTQEIENGIVVERLEPLEWKTIWVSKDNMRVSAYRAYQRPAGELTQYWDIVLWLSTGQVGEFDFGIPARYEQSFGNPHRIPPYNSDLPEDSCRRID